MTLGHADGVIFLIVFAGYIFTMVRSAMKARAAVRDVGRVYGISYDLTDKTAKMIPREIGITIDAALQDVHELKKLYDTNFEVKRLIDISREVEGMPRNITTHAAGLVIGDKALNNYVPTLVSDNTVLTQYPAVVLEKLGLVKMDLLALRNLTIINDATAKIKENEEFELENIKYDDKKVYGVRVVPLYNPLHA